MVEAVLSLVRLSGLLIVLSSTAVSAMLSVALEMGGWCRQETMQLEYLAGCTNV